MAQDWDARIGTLSKGVVHKNKKEKIDNRFVGVLGMTSLCRELAGGLDIQLNSRVEPPVRVGDSWQLNRAAGNTLGLYETRLSCLALARKRL